MDILRGENIYVSLGWAKILKGKMHLLLNRFLFSLVISIEKGLIKIAPRGQEAEINLIKFALTLAFSAHFLR